MEQTARICAKERGGEDSSFSAEEKDEGKIGSPRIGQSRPSSGRQASDDGSWIAAGMRRSIRGRSMCVQGLAGLRGA